MSRITDPLPLLRTRSHVLASRLTAHPDWANRLRADPYTAMNKPADVLRAECAQWCAAAHDVAQGLRWCKYYELARIAWRDWIGGADTEDLLADWSTVADVLLGEALAQAIAPHAASGLAPDSLVLLGLGKLGARELNISSDVDLVCVLAADTGASLREHAVQAVRRFTKIVEQRTADGFLFRVDWDLRPEGRSGPLVLPLDAAVHYYETRGSEWERMMLVRTRPVAGNLHIGKQFVESVHPFVYRRATSDTMLAALDQMKTDVASHRVLTGTDVKHGRGGIREVEFVVHALQLLHGGKHASLRTPHTFSALQALAQSALLPPAQVQALHDGYDFLRRVENAIQIDDERQTHAVPATPRDLDRLAARLAKPADALTTALATHMQAIHAAFHHFMQVPYEKLLLTEGVVANQRTCTSPEESLDGLSFCRRRQVQQWLADDIGGRRPFDDTCLRLTWLADILFEQIRPMASAQCARFGTPRLPNGAEAAFAVLALGSCGAMEMDYASDLDLLFVYEGAGTTDGTRRMTNAEYFAKLAQKIIACLGLPLRYGRLYTVDADLRPSGRSGVLVTTREGFLQYHAEHADTWERQAILRARILAGPAHFADQLRADLHQLPFLHPWQTADRAAIRDLRLRMEREKGRESGDAPDLKFGPGGFTDIETIAQMLTLQCGRHWPATHHGNTWKTLATCGKLGLLDPVTVAILDAAYTWLRRLLAHYRIASHSRTSTIHPGSNHFTTVCTVLRLGPPESVQAKIHTTRTTVRQIFEKFFLDGVQ